MDRYIHKFYNFFNLNKKQRIRKIIFQFTIFFQSFWGYFFSSIESLCFFRKIQQFIKNINLFLNCWIKNFWFFVKLVDKEPLYFTLSKKTQLTHIVLQIIEHSNICEDFRQKYGSVKVFCRIFYDQLTHKLIDIKIINIKIQIT